MARRAGDDRPTATATATAPAPPSRSDDERHFADEIGFFWEDAGGTRMAGRVLGALLLADPPEMSSSDLGRFLGVSSGSISTATRELLQPGLIRRIRVPGRRQDYFRATMGADTVPTFLRSRIEATRRLARLMGRGAELVDGKDPAVRRQLDDIRAFYDFVADEQTAILAKWEARRLRRGPSGG